MKRFILPLAAAAIASALAGAASAQPAAPPAPQASPSAPSLDDRVAALVQAHRCGAARDEAAKGGDQELAREIGDSCGLSPSSSSGKASSGGGSGRRGGGGAGRGGRQGP